MANLSTQPYKGTRDFYPVDMKVRQWIFDRLRQTLSTFGYEEYDGPMLEPFELYASKTSEEIVNEQLYWLVDRGERKLAIRPEMTPTLARMVAARQNELPKPIRWFAIPNLWRYERPQRGRLREHWQLNVDVFGGTPAAEDLEICQVIVAVMEGFGARDGFEVRLNHRGLTNFIFQEKLALAGEKLALAGRLLDGAAKMGEEGFRKALGEGGFEPNVIDSLVRLFKREPIEKIWPDALNTDSYKHLRALLDRLNSLGIEKHFVFDPSVMRGFMYYTGMVLEVYDTHPENNRALFGGGRYDDLVGMFGGKPLPGVGFGMGDVTLRHFLETHKLLPNFAEARGIFVAHLGEEEFAMAQKLARDLRAELAKRGPEIAKTVPVMTALEADKPRKFFTAAEKLGARAVVFVGGDDVKAGKYPMKILGSQAEGAQAAQMTGIASELVEFYLGNN